MSKKEALQTAIALAIDNLSRLDLSERCPLLALAPPIGNTLRMTAFGREINLDTTSFAATVVSTGAPVPDAELILILHYLLATAPVHAAGELISFRNFAGGMFYWNAFVARSTAPLVMAIKNNADLLRSRLRQFDSQSIGMGDIGVRIHAIGHIGVTLVYRLGDEEFSPTADILFDEYAKKVYNAEDAAVLASIICLRLCR